MAREHLSNREPLPHSGEQEFLTALEHASVLSGRVWQAVAIAKLAHHRQLRFDGTPYLEQHVYPVALELSQSGRDAEDGIVVALLHDVLEDCRTIDRGDIAAIFGEQVADAVVTLTKPWARQPDLEADEEAYFASIQVAPELVQRVKVFDRLNNLACVHQRPRPKQLDYARETERFHLPLARQIDAALARRMEALLDLLR